MADIYFNTEKGFYTGGGDIVLTYAEISQLGNIGTTTISETQFGYLGALDQPLSTTDSVEFDDLIVSSVQVSSDSDGAVFGAGNDMKVYYDGTDGRVETNVVADSDLKIKCGTDKTVELEDVVWDDLRIIPGAFRFAGSSDPTLSPWQPTGSGATYRVFEFNLNDEAFGTTQMPHKYKVGSDLYFHIHWTPRGRGSAESGNYVGWKVDYSVASIHGEFGASQTLDLSDVCSGTNEEHEITSSAVVSGTGLGISNIVVFRIYRSDTGSDDTWSNNGAGNRPVMLEFDIHYQIDTMGSRQEGAK